MSIFTECAARLQSSDEVERAYAAEDLGYLNTSEAVAPLIQRLEREPSPVVRDTILQALARIDADEAIEGSISLFASDDAQIRNLAVSVLRLKGGRPVPFLKTVMESGGQDERKFVLDVLSGIDAPEAGEIYAAALSDNDPNVLITAVENLGRIKAVEFRSQVEQLVLYGGHPMLLAVCLEALAVLGDGSSLASIQSRFPDLTALPDFLLPSCLKALAALGTECELADLARLFLRKHSRPRSMVFGALMAIHERLDPHGPALGPGGDVLAGLQEVTESDEHPLCRYQAARVLGFWADRPEVFKFLRSSLESTESMVRRGASESLQVPAFEADGGQVPETPGGTP